MNDIDFTRRRLLAGAAALGTGAALSGCGSSSPIATADAAEPGVTTGDHETDADQLPVRGHRVTSAACRARYAERMGPQLPSGFARL